MDPRLDFNAVIGNVLRYGVIISGLLIGTGIIIILTLDKPSGLPTALNQLVATDYGRPTVALHTLAEGIVSLNPIYVIQLGILVLLATPIARVVFSILLFAAEEDRIYVGLTVFVLCVLLCSIFVVGPLLAR